MDRFERIYQLHKLLDSHRHPVSRKRIGEHLECSDSCVKRLVRDMRNYFDAPIVYDRSRNGYHYDQTTSGQHFELPGLWFNADELWGLLTCHALLHTLSQGIFGDHISQLQSRIERLLALDRSSAERKLGSVKIRTIAARSKGQNPLFNKIAAALFESSQLKLIYLARSDGQTSERNVSPQNLIYYRDNWYLMAWCHSKNQLRTFAIDNIKTATRQNLPALAIDHQRLDDYLASSYGIFSGQAEHIAQLKFSPERARWIGDEQWHPEQTSCWLEDGSYQLSIPFSDHRELLMDILKHGSHVEVLAPEFLRQAAIEQIETMAKIYQK
jgi:predicted DNA-binding transcriptional regulator YafY